MVQRTILRLAFPGGKPRPKPGPYRAPDVERDAATGRYNKAQREPGGGPEQASDGVRVDMPAARS
jgi:hypothetical protein